MICRSKSGISICREIEASTQVVWDILTDTSLWPVWGPSVTGVDCKNRIIREGSKGRVKTWFLLWLPFTITDYCRLKYWNWKVGGVNATNHRVRSIGDRSCLLCFDMPVWAFFYLPVCWLALKRIEKIARQE